MTVWIEIESQISDFSELPEIPEECSGSVLIINTADFWKDHVQSEDEE